MKTSDDAAEPDTPTTEGLRHRTRRAWRPVLLSVAAVVAIGGGSIALVVSGPRDTPSAAGSQTDSAKAEKSLGTTPFATEASDVPTAARISLATPASWGAGAWTWTVPSDQQRAKATIDQHQAVAIAVSQGPYPEEWLAGGRQSAELAVLGAAPQIREGTLAYVVQFEGILLPASSPEFVPPGAPVTSGQLSTAQVVVDAIEPGYLSARSFPVAG